MNPRIANGQHRYPHVIATGKGRTDTPAAAVVARLVGLQGEALKDAVRALDESDLVAFMASDCASRILRTVAVEFVDDAELLVVLASRGLPTFVRKSALQHLGDVLAGDVLTPTQARRLLPCLDHPELIVYAIELMNGAGFDWCSLCTEFTTDVLCSALYGSRGIMEEVLVEDAFAQLAYARPDLRSSLRSCSPERILPMTAYGPSMGAVMRIDVMRADSVA